MAFTIYLGFIYTYIEAVDWLFLILECYYVFFMPTQLLSFNIVTKMYYGVGYYEISLSGLQSCLET